MGNNQNNEMEIDLKELFFVWFEKIWGVLICTLLGMIVAAVFTLTRITPMYQSSAQIYIVNPTSSISLSDLQFGSALTSDYITLITGRTVIEEVISELNLNMSYGSLCGMVSVTNPSDTRFLNITVSNSDPYMAKTIVDKLTEVSSKRIAEVMDLSEPYITELGVVNENPVSPNLKKNILMGGMVGFLLFSGLVVLLYLLDDTIKSTEDIERYLGLETLSVIPAEDSQAKKSKANKKKKRGRSK